MAALAALCACTSSPSAPSHDTTLSSSTGTLVFRATPLDEASIVQIVPLGNLNPPAHTLPTDHIYVNNRAIGAPPPAAPIAVYAPGDGITQWILRSGVESKIGVRSGAYTYYLDHVVLDASIREGMSLTAGQRIGTTGTLSYGIDLGVISDAMAVTFANPARYPSESLHGDAPLRFFDEPLRSRLYALVLRLGGDRDGRFNFDQSGRLVGNWFLETLPVTSSADAAAWPQHLAFVYDNYDSSAIRVSIGGTLGVVGAFAVSATAPDPQTVSTTTGKVAYPLFLSGAPGFAPPPDQRGLLIVQMLDSARIRVEVFVGSTANDAEFTSAARVYVR
jgi:hypothetical protein